MKINIRIIIYTLINFGLLYLILKHFLFKPVNDTIDSRKNEIESNIKKAEEDKKQAEIFKVESEKEIREAKVQGKEIVQQYKLKAEKVSEEIISEAHIEAEKIMERSNKEIERQKEKAEDDIKQNAISLAIQLSSKVLEETIDEEKHRQLIQDFIAKVGN
ncbi:F0F1 ATP synthase subunit B [Clostridium sp. MB40-C1]|uniref:F0F1 ATP synthase subunit B n=1 Tax=Clostridium sp. MB40-C1 TaxID=3070996 RepID=UPI0027E1FF0C|nr:F0F1 ATP synthase subunit B [Clostridium sp. MB40-C1]WMJ79673.1 F0F1 ATP synthase subunit B [Clostridium sp. MB40-C1]